jgi:hypothetical protein
VALAQRADEFSHAASSTTTHVAWWRTVVTDLPEVIPALDASVKRVLEERYWLNMGHAGRIAAKALDWRQPCRSEALAALAPVPNEFRVLLAADVVWLDDLVEPLVRSIVALLTESTADSVLYFAYQERSRHTTNLLRAALAAAGLEAHTVEADCLDRSYTSPLVSVWRITAAPGAAERRAICIE